MGEISVCSYVQLFNFLVVGAATGKRDTKVQAKTLNVLILVISISSTPTKSPVYQNVLCWWYPCLLTQQFLPSIRIESDLNERLF